MRTGRISGAAAFSSFLQAVRPEIRTSEPVTAVSRKSRGNPLALILAPEVYLEEAAVRLGLETARPGDLLVIFGDDLQRDWEQIVGFGAHPAEAPPARPLFAPQTQPLSAVPDRRPNEPEEVLGED